MCSIPDADRVQMNVIPTTQKILQNVEYVPKTCPKPSGLGDHDFPAGWEVSQADLLLKNASKA